MPQRTPIRFVAAVTALAGAAGAAYAGSPYWAVWRIRHAIETRDAASLSRYVDYPAVRAHLKVTMAAQIEARMASRRSDPLAALAGTLGTRLTHTMIEALVTPAGLAAALYGREAVVGRPAPSAAGPGNPAGPAKASSAAQTSLHYRSLDAFEIHRSDPDAAPGEATTIRLQRQGLLDWKIVAIDLPARLLLPR